MRQTRCPNCHRFYVGDAHRCPPRFEVWDLEEDDLREAGVPVFAEDAEAAAVAFVQGHSGLVDGTVIPTAVQDPNGTRVQIRVVVRMTAQVVPA